MEELYFSQSPRQKGILAFIDSDLQFILKTCHLERCNLAESRQCIEKNFLTKQVPNYNFKVFPKRYEILPLLN
jgi:hypothetical protein